MNIPEHRMKLERNSIPFIFTRDSLTQLQSSRLQLNVVSRELPGLAVS